MSIWNNASGAPGPQQLPADPVERGLFLRNGLMGRATGGTMNPDSYKLLRREFMEDPETGPLLPQFIRTCHEPDDFWGHIKAAFDKYEERRSHIREAFAPLLSYLERRGAPATEMITEVLQGYDEAEVDRAWRKALKRSTDDPEGAITAARTLLESVCKHILDEAAGEATYGPGTDLPKLYRLVSERMNLAPSQHTEATFQRLLGGCSSVVEGLGSLRNKVGDAHGQGRRPVRVSARHAHLAVNLAGAMAMFLIETWDVNKTSASG